VNTVSPVPASQTLDAFFLEARCRILDLAAILDRIQRGTGAAGVDADPRIEKIRRALEVLHDQSGGRAERIQQIFSMEYDSGWEKPKPRY
jgi:two-component sensor histidine kinase